MRFVKVLALFISALLCSNGQIIVENSDPGSLDVGYSGLRGAEEAAGSCADLYSVKKSSVVQVPMSEKLGGRLLNSTTGLTAVDCLKRCCQTEYCTVAAFEHLGKLNCYLFDCGNVDDFRCELVQFSNYAVGILTVSRDVLRSRLRQSPVSQHTYTQQDHLIGRPDGHELTTSNPCKESEFKCASSTECIADYDRCNGAFECPDHSDEDKCEQYRLELRAFDAQQRLANSLDAKSRLLDDTELRSSSSDTGEPMWDRGRNRPPLNDLKPQLSEPAKEPDRTHLNRWDFLQYTSQVPPLKPAQLSTGAPWKTTHPAAQLVTPSSTAVPLDRIATTISIVSSMNPHDIQMIHVEKDDLQPLSFAKSIPGWVNFSDPSHFVISILLILTITFCVVTTLFVICRCICTRKPKVTKYRIVDPDAEDFLLGGTYG